jgi:hypothetical protein
MNIPKRIVVGDQFQSFANGVNVLTFTDPQIILAKKVAKVPIHEWHLVKKLVSGSFA